MSCSISTNVFSPRPYWITALSAVCFELTKGAFFYVSRRCFGASNEQEDHATKSPSAAMSPRRLRTRTLSPSFSVPVGGPNPTSPRKSSAPETDDDLSEDSTLDAEEKQRIREERQMQERKERREKAIAQIEVYLAPYKYQIGHRLFTWYIVVTSVLSVVIAFMNVDLNNGWTAFEEWSLLLMSSAYPRNFLLTIIHAMPLIRKELSAEVADGPMRSYGLRMCLLHAFLLPPIITFVIPAYVLYFWLIAMLVFVYDRIGTALRSRFGQASIVMSSYILIAKIIGNILIETLTYYAVLFYRGGFESGDGYMNVIAEEFECRSTAVWIENVLHSTSTAGHALLPLT